jgi:hypothetical protein
VLPELERLELVSVMPRGKFKAYVAESPNRLEKMFENIEDEFNSEIFRMHESYDSKGKKPVITYTEGDGAIKALFSDVVEELNPGDTYYRYSTGLTAARMNLVPRDYRSKRDRKQLERLVITDAKSLVGARKRLGKSVRSVPDDFRLFDDNVTQLIFGNKVAIIDYNSKTVMVIENEMVAAFQKKLFLLTWKMLDR